MVSPRLNKLRSTILERYGIDFNVSYSHGASPTIVLTPLNLSEFKGIQASVKLDWRRVEGDLTLGDFNREILREMEKQKFYNNEIFKTYIAIIERDSGSVQLIVNGKPLGSLETYPVPSDQATFSIKTLKKNVIIDKNNIDEVDEIMETWSSRLVGLLTAVLPIRPPIETFPDDVEVEGLPEGARSIVHVNKYERNRSNRQACIDYHGTTCSICGFNHEKTYGEIGKGFIHVHHLTPVSEIGENYTIKPIQDLIPVCPNCHSMLHRKKPPYTPEELKELIRKRNSDPI